MRILCIADEYPWPATNGLRIRLANTVRALCAAGDVDLFCTVSEREDLDHTVDAPGAARTLVHHRARYSPSIRGVPSWVHSRWPRAVVWRDWDGPRLALREWAKAPYDVVWYCHAHPWLGLGDPAFGPAVVDLDNLEDEILTRMLALGDGLDLGDQPRPTWPGRARRAITRAMTRVDISRWRRVHADIVEKAARTVVCSELDRQRLRDPNAVVVPNGFELDGEPSSRQPRSAAAAFTMVGHFIYEPNIDGAHFFAKQVLPLVRARVPGARFVVAGRHDGALDDLASLDGVEVLGQVPDLRPLFATATAVVTPLRSGSGTRIKVLEAFAHRVPVVSTTLGCEGLGVQPGQEALVADTPEAFADACIRLATDPALADSIASRGHERWLEQFQWSQIRADLTALVRAVAG